MKPLVPSIKLVLTSLILAVINMHAQSPTPTPAPEPAAPAATNIPGAQLQFESTLVKAQAKLEDETCDFIFKFKNTSAKPVRITDVEVSCGCMEATASKGEIGAGESGEIKAIMKIGSNEGESVKFITITTNDPKMPSIQLDCSINVPVMYVFTPPVTTWNIGEAISTKEVHLKIMGAEPVNVLKFASTRPNMQAEMEVTKAGREYVIKLTPKSTEQPELGLVTIETDCKIAKYTKRQIYFTIVRETAPKPIK